MLSFADPAHDDLAARMSLTSWCHVSMPRGSKCRSLTTKTDVSDPNRGASFELNGDVRRALKYVALRIHVVVTANRSHAFVVHNRRCKSLHELLCIESQSQPFPLHVMP